MSHDEHNHNHHHHNHHHSSEDAEPAIYSFSKMFQFKKNCTVKEVEQYFYKAMERVLEFCKKKEAFIGHIKLAFHSQEGEISLSTTGDSINVQTSDEKEHVGIDQGMLFFTAIVYLVEEEELKRSVDEALE